MANNSFKRALSAGVITILLFAFPIIDYRGVSTEDRQMWDVVLHSTNKEQMSHIKKVIIYGREMWGYEDGWYTQGAIIQIDKGGFTHPSSLLNHELAHDECFRIFHTYKHDKRCFA